MNMDKYTIKAQEAVQEALKRVQRQGDGRPRPGGVASHRLHTITPHNSAQIYRDSSLRKSAALLENDRSQTVTAIAITPMHHRANVRSAR